MPWVEFTENFNWTPAAHRRQTTAYKVGHQVLVTTACARAAGDRCKRIPSPARGQRPGATAADG